MEEAVRHLRPLYGNSEAKEFGPNKLTIVREILQGIAACVFDIHPASSDEFVNFIELTDLPQLTAAFTDGDGGHPSPCLLYTSPSPRDLSTSRMPSSA